MMIEGQGMEPQEEPIKVQVVYYLSRAGQLQQPHLVDVTISPNSNGLYLRDVKQRLTAIRGKGVADSFSWSCKRNYKDNYIWQDLANDDKILPLADGEFVLKGSGLYAGYRAPGKSDYLDSGQIDPESTSLSPKQSESVQVYNKIDHKKFDFECVKRNLDQQHDHLQDQSDLAAALSLSLQMMGNPHGHLKRFSKDKSMDLNQQVMNSLSQAKAGPAEECTLDRYDMSSNETFLSEESSTQNNFLESSVTAREQCSKSASSSSRTDLTYDLLVAKQSCQSKDQPISADDRPKIGKHFATGRHEKPEELPPIKTKLKASVAQELNDNAPFMLSPRRIMAVLSTPEKKLGKILHSSSLRSSTLSPSASTHTVDSISAMRFSKQATCLSQLRFCSQLSPHATDSRPDSPVRPSNTISILLQSSSETTQSSSNIARPHSTGPYWTRWKPGRKSRSTTESKVAPELHSTPMQADIRLPESDRTAAVRRALNSSFEFDMPVDANSSGSGTPQLPTGPPNPSSNEPKNPPSLLGKSIKISSSDHTAASADTALSGLKMSSEQSNAAEGMAPISVKEVITELLPVQQPTPAAVDQNFTNGTSVKEVIILLPKHSNTDGGKSFDIDKPLNLPRVSVCDSIPGARAPVTSGHPQSPESPVKHNPPSSPTRKTSPIRTNSPAQALLRPLTSPGGSFNRRTEDGRARARGLVKEVASKDSKFMKDLAKEIERSKVPSGAVTRSIASSKRVSGIKNGATTIGAKSISSTVNKSPPRISALLWEECPQTPSRKNGNYTINRDERPLTAGRSARDWEKTLQEAASVSLPPPDFGQILQQCGQCGRTFKPDSLKVHMRGCRAVRRTSDTEIQTFYGANLASIRSAMSLHQH